MPIFNNPITWAQIRLMGGWKNLAMSCGAYALILCTVMAAFVRGMREPAADTFTGFVILFFALQILTLLLYGTVRVAFSARSDVRSGVIESHRLMPMSPVTAVFGYLFGAPLQALLIYALNYCIGAVAVVGAGLPLDAWTFANLILMAFGVFAWTIVLFFSFRSALALWGAIVCFVALPVTLAQMPAFLPGIFLLASPLMGNTVFALRGAPTFDAPFAAALAAQAFIAGLYFLAATRRYRSSDAIGFGPFLGTLLLAIWIANSIAGAAFRNQFRRYRSWESESDLLMAFATTFALSLLLAILPISSAVRLHRRGRSGFLSMTISPMGAVLLAGVICFVLVDVAPLSSAMDRRTALLRSAIVTLAFCASIRYLLGIVHRKGLRPRLTVLGWLLLTWCVPVLAEVILLAASTEPYADRHLSQVATCSPIVEVFQVWSQDRYVHTDQFAGLAFQCLLAVALGLIYHLVYSRPSASERVMSVVDREPAAA